MAAVLVTVLSVGVAGCRGDGAGPVEPMWDVPVLSGSWTPMAPPPLAARGSAASTVRDGQFVVAGGYVFPRVESDCGGDGGGGGSCGGPAPVSRPDAASWSPATDAWTSLPALEGVVDTYATGPALEPFLGPEGLEPRVRRAVPLTTGDDGRWVGRTFVVAGWLTGNPSEEERKPVAVASFDADTGAWAVDPWPFPDAYQQDLVSVWAGDRLVAIVKAIGPGCSDQRACRRVVTWSPTRGWHQVAEWPANDGDRSPGHRTGFDELAWDGRRVLGVTSDSDGLVVATVSELDGRVAEVGSLPGPVSAPDLVAAHGHDVVVVVGDRAVVLGADGRWARLPAVPGPPAAGRAVRVLGDRLVVWGGAAVPGVPDSVDSAAGWTFPLPT